MTKHPIKTLNINHEAMVQLLIEFCTINSGSRNLNGLALMLERLRQAFAPLACQIESLPLPPIPSIALTGECVMQTFGHALLIRKRPHLRQRVLLCGHMDTVYSADHPFQTPHYLNSNILNGPGVADMKGGLVVMLHALQAFEQTEWAKRLGWDVFINSDEEIGSLASSSLMLKQAAHCQAALVYEPALTQEGVFAKNRKGNGKITLIATGVAAHAGRDFEAGRNAICFLAEIITAIHALNGQREGVTLNIGQMAGGTALNIVPDKAVAKIDIRITFPEDEIWVREQLNQILLRHQKKDYTLTIDTHFDRPVKRVNPATESLFSRIRTLSHFLPLNLDWKDSGGCCDGNNLAQNGLAVIDTLGVRGGHLHSSEEFIILDSLVERATLSALLLIDLAQGGLKQLGRKI